MDTINTSIDNDTLVGNKRWNYIKIVDVLTTSASAERLLNNTFTLARRLQIPICTQMAMQHRISTNIATYNDILYEILDCWRGSQSKKASIFVLVRELEKCGLQNCADDLRGHMSQSERGQACLLLSVDDVNEAHSWNDLSEELKNEIRDKNIVFQGKKIKICKFKQEIQSLMDGKFLRQIIQGEIPAVVHNLVPPQLQYYIQRNLECRFFLKKEIFIDTKWGDVIVIQGLERHELTSLTNHAATDTSGNQLHKLTVRFIMLEHEEDFEKIRKLSSVPVHWIRYENMVYKWIKSSGSVDILQQYVNENKQENLDENEIITATHRKFVISDSPGMGKSQLLVNIAHKMMMKNDLLLVLFISLQEFVPKLSRKATNISTIVSLLAEMSSECEFGRKFVTYVLKSEPCILMLDGFDEVLQSQISTANDLVKELTTLETAKLFVSTRPHMRNELVRTLGVLAYTIKPFNILDQTNFLERYWKAKQILINDSVHLFAKSILSALTSKMTDLERDIAGIPLQCRMLAETYNDDAERCSKVGFENYRDSSKTVTSIFKMYCQYIHMRFEKICNTHSISQRLLFFILSKENPYNAIKHAHMFYALKLLFPEYTSQFQKVIGPHVSVSLHDLCALGILEATQQNDIRFIHRTFAEYFVAWFVVETDFSKNLKEFILAEILKTKPKIIKYIDIPLIMYFPKSGLQCFEFNFPVICYFINGLAGNVFQKLVDLTNEQLVPDLNYSSELLPVYFASALQNYIYIPIFLTQLFASKASTGCSMNTIVDLVFTAAYYSGVELLKIFCDHQDLDQIEIFSTEYPFHPSESIRFTPLHVAVQRGHYNPVNYLIKRYDSKLYNLTHLIHFCLDASCDNDFSTLQEKKQIIKLLLSKSKQWLEEPLFTIDVITPLFQEKCSWELRECLVIEGADVNKFGPSVFHRIVASENFATPEFYHRVVLILKKHGYKFFSICDNVGRTPLFRAVQQCELLPETVGLFRIIGADFNHIDFNRETLLFLAIRLGRSAKLIDLLIKGDADFRKLNFEKKTVLHYSVEFDNSEALEYFLRIPNININAADKHYNTALQYAVLQRGGCKDLMQQLLIKAGADLNLCNLWKHIPLLEAFRSGWGLNISTILLMEEYGLHITKDVASAALNYFDERLQKSPTAVTKFGGEIRYLWSKSGKPDSEFPWKLL